MLEFSFLDGQSLDMACNKKYSTRSRLNNAKADTKDSIGMTLEEMLELGQTRERQNEIKCSDE